MLLFVSWLYFLSVSVVLPLSEAVFPKAAGCKGVGFRGRILCSCLQETVHLFFNHIRLQIDRIRNPEPAKRRYVPGMQNDRYFKVCLSHSSDRQWNAVYCDRSLFDNLAKNGRGSRNGKPDGVGVFDYSDNFPGPINVSAHQVTVKASIDRHGPFQVDSAAGFQL